MNENYEEIDHVCEECGSYKVSSMEEYPYCHGCYLDLFPDMNYEELDFDD